MAKYSYIAKNLKGKEKRGSLEAHDRKHLASLLRQKDYFLLSVEGDEELKKIKVPKLNFLSSLFSVPLTEKLFFTRNLTIMVKTGVPLVRSFEILSKQAKSKRFRKALISISHKITKGENLSGSLGLYPKIFPPLYKETIRVGEETGNLENSLKILSDQMEKDHDLRSKIKSAMVYPVVILCMAFLIGIFMMIFVVPKMKEAFLGMNMQLPITTRMILGFADFLIQKWPVALFLVLVIVVLLVLSLRVNKAGRIRSMIILKIPIISKMVKQTNSALVLRTMSSLMSAGVPIVKSLDITSGALGNFYFKRSLKKASLVVEKGQKLSVALRDYEDIYSPMVLQMIEVGEETGETSTVLQKLAEFFESEVGETTERLSSVIEPFLILLIGVIVGFFAISMVQPMFSVMDGI